MIDLLLWLADGSIETRPIPIDHCPMHIEASQNAATTGGRVDFHSYAGTFQVVRIDCGGKSVVLALPPSSGPCEAEAMS